MSQIACESIKWILRWVWSFILCRPDCVSATLILLVSGCSIVRPFIFPLANGSVALSVRRIAIGWPVIGSEVLVALGRWFPIGGSFHPWLGLISVASSMGSLQDCGAWRKCLWGLEWMRWHNLECQKRKTCFRPGLSANSPLGPPFSDFHFQRSQRMATEEHFYQWTKQPQNFQLENNSSERTTSALRYWGDTSLIPGWYLGRYTGGICFAVCSYLLRQAVYDKLSFEKTLASLLTLSL